MMTSSLIFVQSQNDYIKCFQLNILNLTSKTSSWTELYGTTVYVDSQLSSTYLFEYVNYIRSIKTFTNLDLSYTTGFEISLHTENCLIVLRTPSPQKSILMDLLRNLKVKSVETKIETNKINMTTTAIANLLSAEKDSTSLNTEAVILTTTNISCTYKFGLNFFNPIFSIVKNINA